MQYQTITRSAVATAATALVRPRPAAEAKPALDKAAIDKAFEALKTFDWGVDYRQISRAARRD